MESIIIFCMTGWAGNCGKKYKKLDRLVKKASKYTNSISNVDDLFRHNCLNKITKIIKDSTHPLFNCLTFSKRSNRLLSIPTKTERHRNSFLPHSVRLINSLI